MATQTSKGSALRTERDKFVAFAFAGAHLLIEVDETSEMHYASGTACGLCRGPAEEMKGQCFFDLVAQVDKPYVRELFNRLRTKGRIEPTRVRFQPPGGKTIFALMGGSCLPTVPGHFFLSITMPPQIQHGENGESTNGLLDRDEFTAAATDRLQAATRMAFDHSVTFLVLESLAEFSRKGNQTALNSILEELSAVLRASSIGGDSAGILEDGKFGIVHDNEFDVEEIKSRIENILEPHLGGDRDSGMKTFSLKFDTGALSEIDATKALVYSIHKFTEKDISTFDIFSLESSAQKLLDETADRITYVRRTIDERDFDIVFQPIVGLELEKIHHFEALTRLNGVSSPADFITFTEQVGMIEDFDLTVCQKVLDDIENHAKTGWHPQIALNLSARSLASDLFVKQLTKCTETLGESSKQLMFEITETQAIHDFERMRRVLQGFRDRGHEIALDDMGSGMTALSTLKKLPIDYAKIDGQLIREATEDERTMALLKSIIELSKSLNSKLIAEQIETEKQAMMMHLLGVEFGQGYLFGRPVLDYRGQYRNYHHTKEKVPRKDYYSSS